jgi:hypothetical protein
MDKPKLKHNKKRNTAFLYEALVKELAKAAVEKNETTKRQIVSVLKEFFSTGRPLARELDVYKTLYETKEVDKEIAKSLINESKRVYFGLSQPDIFNEQSRLISKVNKDIGKSVFQHFMPNYKNLATISQIFDLDIPIKTRIILEQTLVDYLTIGESTFKQLEPIDNIVYKTFVKKFNEKYNTSLLEEQKKLLTKYIMTEHDDVEFKIYLNEEIGRIKKIISESSSIKSNKDFDKLMLMLESFKEKQIDTRLLEDIMYLQVLVKETE